jgi:hypothetical protein
VVVVVVGRMEVGGVAFCLALEVTLREGRALVGQLGFGAYEHDAPLESFVAESLGGAAASQARSYDDHGPVATHGFSVQWAAALTATGMGYEASM